MAAFTPSAQLKLTNVAYVRLQKKGKRFEIACYRNKVLSWRNKMETDITEVLQIDTVFTNVSKGMLANAKDLMDAFGTTDQIAVCHEILDKGELQVSEKERGALFDSMSRDIAAIVSDKSVNPENNRPYTISMIQNAMRQIHFSISINKSAKSQALEVIRKLKEVMPIARASMLLRVICPIKVRIEMKKVLEEEMGIIILKEVEVTSGTNDRDDSNIFVNYDIRIDPEMFRKLEESIQSTTKGIGRLDVLLFRDSTPAQINPTKQAVILPETKDKTLSTMISVEQHLIKPKKKSSKKKNKIEKSDDNDDGNEEEAFNRQKSKKKIQFTTLNEEDDDDDDDDHGTGNEEEDNESKNDIDSYVEKIDKLPETDRITNQAIDSMEQQDRIDLIPKEKEERDEDSDSDSDSSSDNNGESTDESNSKSDEDVIGMVKSKTNQKKKHKKKLLKEIEEDMKELNITSSSSVTSSSLSSSNTINKKSKKAKRIEKEESKEKQKKIDILRNRIDEERSRNIPLSKQIIDSNEVLTTHEKSNTSMSSSNISTSSVIAKPNINKGTQSCNTCGGAFVDATAYRNHFRSEWHRHNLKRKMKNLQIVTSEEEFVKLPIEEIEI